MLNNAIEHSSSEKIDMIVTKTSVDIRFTVADQGVGIFNNIMKKKRLVSTMDAIQDLLKGKKPQRRRRTVAREFFLHQK